MKKTNTKNKKSAFQINRKVMTDLRIASMEIMDSYLYLRLLKDPITGNYVVFNNYSLNSMYSKDYRVARQFFEKQANKLDN